VAILVNRAREVWRSRGHEVDAGHDHDRPGAPDPAAALADHLDLERALARLAPGYREVVILHDVEGFTHEEIGSLLDIDPGTSRSQLVRARGRLRHLLQGNPDESP
jgi:RNA polymerase sigma-70 factor (ECF subfamily)